MLDCISGDLSRKEKIKLLNERLEQNCLRIHKICEEEGIPAGHRRLISKIIKSIGPEGETYSLTSPQALDLVSALYVAHDWDVWGRLAFPLKAEGDQWPINAARLGSFSYVIDYPDENADNILGYRVDLLCAAGTRIPPKNIVHRKPVDWSGIYASYAKFGPMAEYGDYFRHCYDVEKAQRDSYRLYGHLIDQVARSVADQRTIFIRCFPLRICGYDHFIQVLLKPNEAVSIEDCGIDLPKVFSNPEKGDTSGKPPELLILKECLREMIVQMHVAAFQRAIVAELENSGSDDLGEAFAIDLFARHAPNLVRMTRVWVNGNGYGYTYASAADSEPEEWVRTVEADDNWEEFGDEENDKRFLTMTCGIRAHVPWEGDFEPLSALLGGTGKMRLEEQWDWLGGAIKRFEDARELKLLRSKSGRRSSRSQPHAFNQD